MKKERILIGLLVVVGLFLYFFIGNEKDLSEILGKEFKITKHVSLEDESVITKTGQYALDCKTANYTAINISGILIPKSYIKISEGNEKQVLYVENETAKFFGADYSVIQDDANYLIMMRSYPVSGLTETITLNKERGIGFDVKTLGFGIGGGPHSDTYILNCAQI